MTNYICTHANSFNYLIDVTTAPSRGFAVMHNAMVRLKWYMLSLPAWRGAVIKALGGDAALLRWERRAARAGRAKETPQLNAAEPPEPPASETDNTARRRYKPFKTDADGLFRLARIPAYAPWVPPLAIEPKAPGHEGIRGPRLWRMTVIAVTPDELRGKLPDEHGGKIANELQGRLPDDLQCDVVGELRDTSFPLPGPVPGIGEANVRDLPKAITPANPKPIIPIPITPE